jgi:hypothetical protein
MKRALAESPKTKRDDAAGYLVAKFDIPAGSGVRAGFQGTGGLAEQLWDEVWQGQARA